jgi:signal transduction histidine kinase/cytochrome b561
MTRTISSSSRYSMILQTIHWLVTLLVSGQIAFIFCVRRLQSFEFANAVLGWHRSCGVLILILVVTRIVIAPWVRAPAFAKPMPPWQAGIARAVHGVMLAALIALPLIGMAMAGARGDTISFFGITDIPAVVGYDPDLSDTLLRVHALLAASLAGLIAIHLGAVGFHFIVQKRNIALRMLPQPQTHLIVNRIPFWGQIAMGCGCLLALTFGVGIYAEEKTLQATQLSKTLHAELLDIGDDITALERDAAELSKDTAPLNPEARRTHLSSMKAQVLDIKRRTIDERTKNIAQNIIGRIILAEPIAPSQSNAESGNATVNLGAINVLLDELANNHREFVFRQRLAVERASSFGHDMILISIVPTAFIGLLVTILLSRNILGAVRTARTLAASIASGDFTNERRIVGHGETAQLVRGLLSMQDALRKQMEEIAHLAQERQEEQLERQRLRIAKEGAEAANRTKSQFLATMSHELRTPLNAIIGFSEIIKGELFGPVQNRNYVGYAADIFNSGTHLLQLINDILDMSHLESRQLELREQEVDLHVAVSSCMRLVEMQADQAKVHLSTSLDDDLPSVRADDRRLRQILINIIANAVKFTPEGGRVTVSGVQRDGGVALVIADTGIGMAPEDIPKAMQPFGQIDSKLSRKYQGTGLGLPLAKHLAILHGGTLTIESEVNVGTTITVTLPSERVISRPLSSVGPRRQVSMS